MSLKNRVLESGLLEITQEYKQDIHNGIDVVNQNYTLGNIVAHSDGVVVGCRNNCNGFENGSYGNYVKIKHDNGYYTLYGHMAYNTVRVSVGQRVSKGQVLGYMGNTGMSYGGHLHFEVRTPSDVRINPTEYLNADLPNSTPVPTKSVDELANEVIQGLWGNGQERKDRLGDRYAEVQTRVNEILAPKVNYLSNTTYTGVSIVDGLKGIGVDSSYNYRSKLAEVNGIANYCGTAEQNTKMLEMLKNGTLKSV